MDNEEKYYYTTNNTSGTIKLLAIIFSIVGIIGSFALGINTNNFIIAICGGIISLLNALLLYAVGEGISIMHDIRTNSEHIRDFLERK